jgi:hypothetical protein
MKNGGVLLAIGALVIVVGLVMYEDKHNPRSPNATVNTTSPVNKLVAVAPVNPSERVNMPLAAATGAVGITAQPPATQISGAPAMETLTVAGPQIQPDAANIASMDDEQAGLSFEEAGIRDDMPFRVSIA